MVCGRYLALCIPIPCCAKIANRNFPALATILNADFLLFQFVFCHLAFLEYVLNMEYIDEIDLTGFDDDCDSE